MKLGESDPQKQGKRIMLHVIELPHHPLKTPNNVVSKITPCHLLHDLALPTLRNTGARTQKSRLHLRQTQPRPHGP